MERVKIKRLHSDEHEELEIGFSNDDFTCECGNTRDIITIALVSPSVVDKTPYIFSCPCGRVTLRRESDGEALSLNIGG